LSELAKLGARLIIQRAVEDEFDAWLGRARYERRPEYQRGLRNYDSGLGNGFRPRTVQTAEGELEVAIPQVREAAETFASKLFLRTPTLLRTQPLKALVIGAFVRGLSMRDVESLYEQAGLGKLSKSTASRICQELRERYEAFKRRDPYEVRLVALFLDATFIAVRHDGPKEAVLVAWGITEEGERLLLSVTLGMREHRGRNLYAKLPERERERVKHAYWQALDDAISASDAKAETPRGHRRARQGRLHRRGHVPRRRPRRARRAPALPTPAPPAVAEHKPARALARRSQTPHQGDGPLPGRGKPHRRLGRP
jgi:transposase-like protein